MIPILVLTCAIIIFFDLLSLFYISSSVSISIFVVSQIIGGLTGLILLKRKDINVVYFVENQLKNGTPVIKEIWLELIVVIGYLLLCLPGYISDIIGISLLFNKVQMLIYKELNDLIKR